VTRLPPHCAQITYQNSNSAKPVNAPYYRNLGVESVPLTLQLPKLEHTRCKLIQISDRKGITVNAGERQCLGAHVRPLCVLLLRRYQIPPNSTCYGDQIPLAPCNCNIDGESLSLVRLSEQIRDRTRIIVGRRLCHCAFPFPALPATFRLGFLTFPSGSSGTAGTKWHCITLVLQEIHYCIHCNVAFGATLHLHFMYLIRLTSLLKRLPSEQPSLPTSISSI
jgi:hypothetical protein